MVNNICLYSTSLSCNKCLESGNDFLLTLYNFFLSTTILVHTGSRPLNAIDFVFCTNIVKPYSVII